MSIKISTILCTLAFLLFGCQNKHEPTKPNIIFVLVDDLGWRDVSYMGSLYYETPNIDRLAGMGMAFTNAYAACAVCSPTRASIMTGKYPARTGVTNWIHFLDPEAKEYAETEQHPANFTGGFEKRVLCPPNHYWMDLEETTIAEVLKEHGYVTAHIGKWHLGPEKWWPDKQGFDQNIGGADLGQPPSYFDPYKRNEKRPGIPTLKPGKEGEYLTDREAGEAVKFIRENKDTTFFLNLWHYAVHTPIQAKEEIIERYKQKDPDSEQKNPKYAAMIESVDEAMGRIVQTLEENNLMDKTIIIFFSDNGGLVPVTSNVPLRSGKGFPYEGGIREPMFVYWPGVVEPETVSDVPVTSVDFFPTICKMTGIELPVIDALDGLDLSPVLTGDGGLDREAIFWHFPHYRGRSAPYSIIRKGNFKLIKRYDGKPFELFDLEFDLGETIDLSDSLPGKVEELNALLENWLQETGAKVPIPNPDFSEPEKVEHMGVRQPVALEYEPDQKYAEDGAGSLLDGWLGGDNYKRGWLGFEGNDLIATIDLEKIESYSKVSVRFFQNSADRIFLPEWVAVSVSSNGTNFTEVDKKVLDKPRPGLDTMVKDIDFSFYPKDYRYLRLVAKNLAVCPEWHRGAGGKTWLFVDEIIIE